MEKHPIEEQIIKALIYYKRPDLARLLKNSEYELNETNSYGRAWNSISTGVFIYSDIDTYHKLLTLKEPDKEKILEAFHVLYPIQPQELDLSWIEFFIDPTLDIPLGQKVETKLDKIGFEYISEQLNKCDQKIAENDLDGSVTNARTLLETILKYILDQKKIEYDDKDDITKLYGKVADILKMNPVEYENKSFKRILSGFFSIVQGISEIRNKLSDAHGKSSKQTYKLQKRHAKLTVDSAKIISEFLYNSFFERKTSNNSTA